MSTGIWSIGCGLTGTGGVAAMVSPLPVAWLWRVTAQRHLFNWLRIDGNGRVGTHQPSLGRSGGSSLRTGTCSIGRGSTGTGGLTSILFIVHFQAWQIFCVYRVPSKG